MKLAVKSYRISGVLVGRFRHFVSLVCHDNRMILSTDDNRTINRSTLRTYIVHSSDIDYSRPAMMARPMVDVFSTRSMTALFFCPVFSMLPAQSRHSPAQCDFR